MGFAESALGFINLEKLLAANRGNVKTIFLDMGSEFVVENNYEYVVNGEKITIWSKKNPKNKINMQKKIELTPQMVACIGLYEGDGSKHAKGGTNIGFSQREIHLHKFIFEQIEKFFPNTFKIQWSILDDPRSLEKPERQIRIANFKTQIKSQAPVKCTCKKSVKNCDCGAIELQKKFLIYELQNEGKNIGFTIQSQNIRTPTISPVKGGLERIQEFDNSKDFLSLWLNIEHIIVDNIVNNIPVSENEEFVFYRKPHESEYFLDVEKYAKSIKWKNKISIGRYAVKKLQETIVLSRSKRAEIQLEKSFPLSSLSCLVSGLYLAEGSTKKDYFFLFEAEQVTLNVSLTHTDPVNIEAFCKFLEYMGTNLIVSWKVKVGTKYAWEVEQLAQRYGVVTLRGGEKGQGYLRTSELDYETKNWAISHVKYLGNYSELFHHTEITGVGVPRIDISSNSVLSHYLISFIRDVAFFTKKLDVCTIKK